MAATCADAVKVLEAVLFSGPYCSESSTTKIYISYTGGACKKECGDDLTICTYVKSFENATFMTFDTAGCVGTAVSSSTMQPECYNNPSPQTIGGFVYNSIGYQGAELLEQHVQIQTCDGRLVSALRLGVDYLGAGSFSKLSLASGVVFNKTGSITRWSHPVATCINEGYSFSGWEPFKIEIVGSSNAGNMAKLSVWYAVVIGTFAIYTALK